MFKPPTSTSENIVSHDVCEHLIVSSLDIFNYFGNSKRPIREGTELLNAGWVTTLGIAPVPAKKRVIGLVIQTSSISASPHEVKMDFLTEQVKYWKCVCSCKAGVGEKCKHIAACLLHINRYPTIHGISSTELKQKWGKTGRSIAKNFSSVCTTEMCHVRKEIFMVDDHITEEIQKSVALKFLKGIDDTRFVAI